MQLHFPPQAMDRTLLLTTLYTIETFKIPSLTCRTFLFKILGQELALQPADLKCLLEVTASSSLNLKMVQQNYLPHL
jgi:hypothetical protein